MGKTAIKQANRGLQSRSATPKLREVQKDDYVALRAYTEELIKNDYDGDRLPTYREFVKARNTARLMRKNNLSSPPEPRVQTPQEIEALEANRWGTTFRGPNQKICESMTRGTGKRCTQMVVRGLNVCRHHGGKKFLKQRKIEQGFPTRTKTHGKALATENLLRPKNMPEGLIEIPIFYEMLISEAGKCENGYRFIGRLASPEEVRLKNIRTRRLNILGIMITGYLDLKIDPTNRDTWDRSVMLAEEFLADFKK